MLCASVLLGWGLGEGVWRPPSDQFIDGLGYEEQSSTLELGTPGFAS